MTRTLTIATVNGPAVLDEADRRRTFAVISHPDAGKSTLTESLALYSSVIKDAGVTHGKSSRHGTVSDWMGMEQERGISVSSAALQLSHRGAVLNVVDTPGHADFSEDSYRVLAAVDFAVMLIDAAKGFEPQTLKLLAVCRRRGLPIITVINKWDRPGLEALDLIDGIEEQTGMAAVPLTWPTGKAGDFHGLLDLRRHEAVSLEAVRGGALPCRERTTALSELPDGPGLQWAAALEEADLVQATNGGFDRAAFHGAKQTPVLFTAAAKNFGVRQLLDVLADLGPGPSARRTTDGGHQPVDAGFSGFVFKVQSGQDAAHRDHIAFLRVCSGVFERGMILTNARLGRPFATKYAHRVIGRSREVLDLAWPGDIVGLVNAASLRVGDSLSAEGEVRFPEIPHFAPELFSVARAVDPGRYKQFRRGITGLEHEGVVQVLRSDRRGDQAPVLAAVGALQFEVAQERMAKEFHAPATFEPLPYTLAMRLGAASTRPPETFLGGEIMHRSDGENLVLFTDRWKLEHFRRDNPGLELTTIGS
ncbi:peptide chain release factor 3 [Arthrobacter sp. ISL-95]|uniref:peptide chain release factor 3 n=1 Tax=Arthrobacter sp. ISL-95 TaxID=2819116 RepID=UPI001BE75989|nr:peptide chain release factor 3 [Arthrobacter sp. ISL-95]MBT2586499.1 peptide chain release factor 3 [Arthrobacter sp. ISL-95]